MMLLGVFIGLSFIVRSTTQSTVAATGNDSSKCSTNEEEISHGNITICCVFFNASTWEIADKTCRSRNMFLMDFGHEYYPMELFRELLSDKEKSLGKHIWIGMRKESGRYMWKTNRPRLFKEDDSYGNKWHSKAQEHEKLDCVALDIKKESLVKENCSRTLRFVCMADGYSGKPIDTPSCPPDWSFSYHLHRLDSGCYRAFPNEACEEPQNICKEAGGKVMKEIYVKLTDVTVSSEQSDSNCEKKVTCQTPAGNVELDVWISKSKPTDEGHPFFTCKVNYNGRDIEDKNALHFIWYKDGLLTGEYAERLGGMKGVYQCEILLAGKENYFESQELNLEYCSKDKTTSIGRVFTWPITKPGMIAFPEPWCFTDKYKAVVRTCLKNSGGTWTDPDGKCATTELPVLTTQLRELSKEPVDENNVRNISERLSNLTRSDKLNSADVLYIATILRNVANTPVTDSNVVEAVSSVVDNVIDVNPDVNPNVSFNIIDSWERTVSTFTLENDTYRTSSRNKAAETWDLSKISENLPVGMTATSTDAKSSLSITTIYNDSDSFQDNVEAGIIIPLDLVSRMKNRTSNPTRGNRLTFTMYRDTSLFMSAGFTEHWKINSYIVRAFIADVELPDFPVRIFLKPFNVSKEALSNTTCFYWEGNTTDISNGWFERNCSYKNERYLIETRNYRQKHIGLLSLLGTDRSYISKGHQLALGIIFYIGCGLSILGLVMTIISFLLLRKWRKGNKHKALVNLCSALLLVLLVFVVGIDKSNHDIPCMIVAILLHYFLLSSFAWMLVEAIMQYLNFVKVLSTYIPRFIRKSMICGWGCPALIVGIILIVNKDAYRRKLKDW